MTAKSLRAHGRGYRLDRCDGCGLVPEGCGCKLLPRVANVTRVTLVAHFRELRKPSNTGRIALRMLENGRLLERGRPEERDAAPVDDAFESLDRQRALLLFPSEGAEPLESVPREGGPYELIVPDGTWSQTRRVVRRHKALQGLRAVRLPEASSSYFLRRGPVPGLCCTVEAIAGALRLLEGDAVADPLLQGFAAWQRAALAVRGTLKLLPDLGTQFEEV